MSDIEQRRLDAIETAINHKDAEWAKTLIIDCYGLDYLQSAWINRTQDPLFGDIGKIAASKNADCYRPHQLIRYGYEFLAGIDC